MKKILLLIKNNMQLSFLLLLVLLPILTFRPQTDKPNAKALTVSAQLRNFEAGVAAFDIKVTNQDKIPYTYWQSSDGNGLPSKHFVAEVTNQGATRTSRNKNWERLPASIPDDQILISNSANDRLGSGATIEVAPGDSADTLVYLENLPRGQIQVAFKLDGKNVSPSVEVVVP